MDRFTALEVSVAQRHCSAAAASHSRNSPPWSRCYTDTTILEVAVKFRKSFHNIRSRPTSVESAYWCFHTLSHLLRHYAQCFVVFKHNEANRNWGACLKSLSLMRCLVSKDPFLGPVPYDFCIGDPISRLVTVGSTPV